MNHTDTGSVGMTFEDHAGPLPDRIDSAPPAKPRVQSANLYNYDQAKFTIEDMYVNAQLIDNTYADDHYEVKPKYFDTVEHQKHNAIFDNECNCYGRQEEYKKPKKVRPRTTTGGPKKPVKDKNIIFNMTKKHSQNIPGPWQYDVFPKWLKHPRNRDFCNGVSRAQKKLQHAWSKTPHSDGKRTPPGEAELAADPKIRQRKIDPTASKHTMFDNLIRDNTRKEYPKPGPDYYFLDKQSLNKFPKGRYPDGAESDLFNAGPEKDVKKKDTTTREKRNFVLSDYEAAGPSIPGPGRYYPKYPKSTDEKYTWTNLDPKKDPDTQSYKT
jgi:hypothetical protein